MKTEMELYSIYWENAEDNCFMFKSNITEEDLKKEIKQFKETVDFDEIWEDFPKYLCEKGYKVKPYYIEEPTYICFDEN